MKVKNLNFHQQYYYDYTCDHSSIAIVEYNGSRLLYNRHNKRFHNVYDFILVDIINTEYGSHDQQTQLTIDTVHSWTLLETHVEIKISKIETALTIEELCESRN